MSRREDRYLAAVCLAQMILEDPVANDGLRIEQALQDIRDEVSAGRKNQELFPVISAELFDQLANGSTRAPLRLVVEESHSMRVRPKEAS